MDRSRFIIEMSDATMPGVPLVEIAGYSRVLVEHHLGITQFSSQVICLKVRFGEIRVCGCDLTICQMTKEQLVISGEIESVTIFRG